MGGRCRPTTRTPTTPASPAARPCWPWPMGNSYTATARATKRRSAYAVSNLVSHVNREVIAAVEPRHGGDPRSPYTAKDRERILREEEACEVADREKYGSATACFAVLSCSLGQADDRLPEVSTYTICFPWETGELDGTVPPVMGHPDVGCGDTCRHSSRSLRPRSPPGRSRADPCGSVLSRSEFCRHLYPQLLEIGAHVG